MFLQKKKIKGPEIGDIVEIMESVTVKVNKKIPIAKQRIDSYDKYIIVDIFEVKTIKYARLIDVKINYSFNYNYNYLTKKAKFIAVEYSSLMKSRANFNDAFGGSELAAKDFIRDKYGIK